MWEPCKNSHHHMPLPIDDFCILYRMFFLSWNTFNYPKLTERLLSLLCIIEGRKHYFSKPLHVVFRYKLKYCKQRKYTIFTKSAIFFLKWPPEASLSARITSTYLSWYFHSGVQCPLFFAHKLCASWNPKRRSPKVSGPVTSLATQRRLSFLSSSI